MDSLFAKELKMDCAVSALKVGAKSQGSKDVRDQRLINIEVWLPPVLL